MSARIPILVEPNERYWRRRANRRVRKARLARNVLRWSLVLSINGAIALTVFVVGVRSVTRLAQRPEFALKHIDVRGAQRTAPDEIARGLEPFVGANLFQLDLHGIESEVRRNPWVRDASVRRILPASLRVAVTERTPAALAVIDGLAHLVDETGFVIGPAQAGNADDLPVLIGLDRASDGALAAELARGVRIVGRLRREAAPFAEGISEIDLSRPDRVAVRTVAPGPAILLDPSAVERNVMAYLELRAEIEDRLGTVEYVDLRWDGRIAVMPAEPPQEEEGG